MLITNIRDFKNLNLYKCNKKKSLILQKNGFHLIGYDNHEYFFLMTDRLSNFLKSKGGDDKVE